MAPIHERNYLYPELVKQLYKQAPLGIFATLVNSFVLTFILWKVIPHSTLILWLSAVVLITILRAFALFRYRHSSTAYSETIPWNVLFITGMGLSGMIWGSAAIFLFPGDSIPHQVFLAFVLGGMVAGAAGTFSIVMKVFLVFSLPTIIPIIIQLFAIGDEIHLAMGTMTLLFALLMFLTAKRINAVTVSSIKLQFENTDLINNLTIENERVEKLNKRMESEITERSLAKNALRESEEKYRNIVENSLDVIMLTQPDGIISYMSPACKEVLGYEPKDLVGRQPWIIHPDDLERVKEVHYQTLKGESGSNFEYRINTKTGETKWISHSWSPIFADDKLRFIVSVVRDITQGKRTEEALRESERKYRDLFENVLDFIYVHDFEGKFLETNLPFLEEMGYGKEDFANLKVRDLIPERYKPRFEDYISRIKENGKDEGLMKVMTKDGRERTIEYRNSLVYGLSGPKAVRGSARDITERIQAEMELRESEEKYRKLYDKSKSVEEVYRSILDTSADAMIIYDMKGKAEYISPAFTQIFGWTTEEVEGKHIPFLPESEREATMAGIKEIIGNGKAIQGFETKRYTKDGRIIDVNISGSRYNDHEGKPAGMLAILRDTTEKKTLEAQLQRAQKMETIGTLAGGVAHDLNNILSGIVSYPDLLLMQLPEDSPLREPILTIQESGNKAATIVQDLLTMARRGVAITEVVNLKDIIYKYLKSPEYEKLKSFHPDVEVKIEFAEDLLNISGSTVHLSKTIMNLVSNAAEALPDGGKILITTENRHIDRLLRGYEKVDEGDYVILTVADTGVGISSEDIAMIFEPFYTKKKMGRSGTGLGMTVVWGTVKDHNGYIDIQSTEGKGTTFTLYFPATRQQSAKDQPRIPIEEYKGKGESILVVDDVGVQRDIATGMLSELGYSVTAVSSGGEAVEYLKEHTVDLMVLDMIMDPGIDGLETYKRILEFHPNQKAVIASGFSETDRLKEAQKLGAGPYIKKPYTLKKIGIVVKSELEK